MPRARVARAVGALIVCAIAPGCSGLHEVRLAPGEAPTPIGRPARDNRTPMDPALDCLASRLAARSVRPPVIAVGDVRDYTGKYAIDEGAAITQGGALMVSSALGKLAPGIRIAERFDPAVAERELAYMDHRQLGDGARHTPGPGAAPVAWLPYYGGSIAASDYFIVGGITELNYDIRSKGAEARAGQIGPKARTYTQSVAIDLRIVDTRSLLVVKTVSLTKQFTGYEVGFDLFRFFGSTHFDINLGAKGQEPLQLGIRTALEEATLQLVAAATQSDPAPCLARQDWWDRAPAPASNKPARRPEPSNLLLAGSNGTPHPPLTTGEIR
ncbi:CsgG/HfaB family protein [Sphingomonas sp.]|uniref:CsgG/HfaB family protein n=1 Tax=Sphingomonas sp. TaxID=28214 RepID=UPI0025EAD286|nr:CsgG/HfaB family protein [Sphingomonas sp.]